MPGTDQGEEKKKKEREQKKIGIEPRFTREDCVLIFHHGLTSGQSRPDGGSLSQGTNPMPSILRVHQRKVPFLPRDAAVRFVSCHRPPSQAPPRPAHLHVFGWI